MIFSLGMLLLEKMVTNQWHSEQRLLCFQTNKYWNSYSTFKQHTHVTQGTKELCEDIFNFLLSTCLMWCVEHDWWTDDREHEHTSSSDLDSIILVSSSQSQSCIFAMPGQTQINPDKASVTNVTFGLRYFKFQPIVSMYL